MREMIVQNGESEKSGETVVLNDTPKCRSVVQNGFGVVPSVPDGNIPEFPVFSELPDYENS
ncbi:MAG: hypothetical protein WC721_12800 [Victivallaceae bacterium]|jgi:hypothetical protein